MVSTLSREPEKHDAPQESLEERVDDGWTRRRARVSPRRQAFSVRRRTFGGLAPLVGDIETSQSLTKPYRKDSEQRAEDGRFLRKRHLVR